MSKETHSWCQQVVFWIGSTEHAAQTNALLTFWENVALECDLTGFANINWPYRQTNSHANTNNNIVIILKHNRLRMIVCNVYFCSSIRLIFKNLVSLEAFFELIYK